MTKTWTDDLIESAKRTLSRHTSFAAALEEISSAVGFRVTADGIQKGFKRAGAGAPSSFLAKSETQRSGPSVLWNEAMLDAAAEILRGHSKLPEAVADIREQLGVDVGIESMRVAFTRAGRGLPTAYLQKAGPAEVKRIRDMNPVESAQYSRDAAAARKDFRHQGRTEAIIEGIRDGLAALKPIAVNVSPRPSPTRTKGPREWLWFDVSDVHVGHVIEPGSVGGLNSHEHRDFLAKMDRWVAHATALIEERQHCAAAVEGVVIATLGDFVDGHEIYRGQAWECSHDIYMQLVDGSQAYAAALAKLAGTFPHLRFSCYGIAGNHGRIATPNNAPFRSNFDLIAYAMIESHLKAAGLPNLTSFSRSSAFFSLVETFGLVHLLIHGDHLKSRGSAVNAMRECKAELAQLFETTIHFSHCGHHHAEAFGSDAPGDAMANGSWIGTSEYGVMNLLKGQRACQMAYVFNEDGLAQARKLYLQSRSEVGKVTIHKAGA